MEKRSDFLKLITPLDCADYPNLLEIYLVIMLTGCSYFSTHLVILTLPLHGSPLYFPNVDLFPEGFSLEAGLLCPVLWVLFHHVIARTVTREPPSLWSLSPGSLIS